MYDELDKQILAHILDCQTTNKVAMPLYYYEVVNEARRIGYDVGRYWFPIIDGRLQALRKAGKIKFDLSTVSEWVVL